MTYSIDLNCDMGEFDHIQDCANDIHFMPYISRCNIAVGGHIGNKDTIALSFREASNHGLKIGLHPSYPDRAGFGRERSGITTDKLVQSLREQIELGISIADHQKTPLSHIKFHGALYNHLEQDESLAEIIAEMVADYQLDVLGMANGQFQQHCQELGLTFIREAFVDRRYLDETHLRPRSETGSVLIDTDAVLDQALALATRSSIITSDGNAIDVCADSLCLHSDTPGAINMVKAIHRLFAMEAIRVY